MKYYFRSFGVRLVFLFFVFLRVRIFYFFKKKVKPTYGPWATRTPCCPGPYKPPLPCSPPCQPNPKTLTLAGSRRRRHPCRPAPEPATAARTTPRRNPPPAPPCRSPPLTSLVTAAAVDFLRKTDQFFVRTRGLFFLDWFFRFNYLGDVRPYVRFNERFSPFRHRQRTFVR